MLEEAYKWTCQNCEREYLAYVHYFIDDVQIDLPLCQCGAQTSIKRRGEAWSEYCSIMKQGPSVTPLSN